MSTPPTAQKELHSSEIRYRRLFEASQDGILILDAVTLEIIDVNPFMLKLLGYSRQEFLGKELWEIGLFGDKGASQTAFKGLQDTGYLRYEDLPLETRSGEKRDVEFVSNVYDEDGQQVIQCNIRDITERRQAEMVRERLAAIVKSSDDAIISTELGGIVTTWNSAAEKMFGYKAAEILGQPLSILIPKDRSDEERKILDMILRGETLSHFETVRIGKNGKAIDVSVTISPIKNDEGKIIGASKIARNISELKRAIKEIRSLNTQLEQRVTDPTAQLQAVNDELESFSYSVSHDLRAPLRHIDGFSGALLEDYADKLDDVGKGYLTQEMVDLSEMASSIVADMRNANPERQVTFNIKDGLKTRGDKQLLQILLTNIIGNAWKFSSKTENAKVTFDREQDDGKTVYFICDNGVGFDMKFADKLFGAFQRLHSVAEFEGTGIGLATVQRIINRHGGRVWAEGAVDVGAAFYFTLPDLKEQGNED